MSRPLPLLSFSILATALAVGVAPAQTRRNVMLIVADDLGVDYVSAYGEGPGPGPTPVLDYLASQGVLFRNAWTNPQCSPTRAALMTGRHAYRHKVGKAITTFKGISAGNVLSPEETTLPELLDRSDGGYSHAFIGKWHLGDHSNGGELAPNIAGFSHFAGFLYGTLGGDKNYYRWQHTVDGVTTISTTYNTTQTVDDALAWIQTAPEPWVCVVSFPAPHRPLHIPPAHLHTQNLAGITPMTNPVPFFRAAVQAMDTEIGRLLRGLQFKLARTNVLFMGDNGSPKIVSVTPFSGNHAKSTVFEGGVNVPLIAYGPDVNFGGREESALVSAPDVMATILELTNTATPPGLVLDGLSFARHLQAAGQPAFRPTVFTEIFDGNDPRTNGFAAVRDERFKLVRNFDGDRADLFYDLWLDPFENSDLLGSPLSSSQQTHYQSLDAEIRARRSP